MGTDMGGQYPPESGNIPCCLTTIPQVLLPNRYCDKQSKEIPIINCIMASVAQFTILKLKPGTAVEEAGTPAYDALQDVIASLKEGDGNQGVFFGRQIENPDFAVLASCRSSSFPTTTSFNTNTS